MAARGAGDLLPELVYLDHHPMAKRAGKEGQAESSPTFIAGASPDFAGVLGLSFHRALGLFLCFSFFLLTHLMRNIFPIMPLEGALGDGVVWV